MESTKRNVNAMIMHRELRS